MKEKKKGILTMEAKERMLAVLSPLGLLLIWQVLSWFKVLDARFIPSPITIGD